jgi:4-diphosphocytidyl-2-C-methyl-D-erythritol kinase
VLVNPGFGIETAWAYRQLSTSRQEVLPLEESYARMGQSGRITWAQLLATARNDFESPVFQAHPTLLQIKQRLLAEGAQAALLSGSGATVFGVFHKEPEASKAAAAIQADSQLKVFTVPACSGPLLCRE